MEELSDTRVEPLTERVIGAHTRGRPGPTLICVCGVHGNEPGGGLAARRVLDELGRTDPESFFGRFVAITGNIAARNQPGGARRYIDQDLNRLFTAEAVAAARKTTDTERTAEQREMLELLDVLEAEFATSDGPVFLLDLHTFSSRGYPFGAIEDSIAARSFAKRFPIPVVLGMEEELNGLLIDYIGQTYAHVAMIFEGGPHHEEQSVVAHEAAIRIALNQTGVMPDVDVSDAVRTLAREAGVRSGRFYDIRHCEPIRDTSFEMIEGIESTEVVRRGAVLAKEAGNPCRAPVAGVLFLPNRNAGRRVGDDAYFIIRRVDRLSLWMSERVRRFGAVHRIAPRALPGVRRFEGDPNRLLVAPEIAVVFKRELFHLLGYRIVRHGVIEHRSPAARMCLGLIAAVRAIGKVAVGAFYGGERAALPHERPDDWIVTRRRLDIRDRA